MQIYQVDAFAKELFQGNPAAVVPLKEWLPDGLLQQIAMENNLAETAFFVPEGKGFSIRWFTPTIEVALCGHATLASGHVLFEHLGYKEDVILFHTRRSGDLKVSRGQGGAMGGAVRGTQDGGVGGDDVVKGSQDSGVGGYDGVKGTQDSGVGGYDGVKGTQDGSVGGYDGVKGTQDSGGMRVGGGVRGEGAKAPGQLTLDFPATPALPVDVSPDGLFEGLGITPRPLFKGPYDYMVVLDDQLEVEALDPDFRRLAVVPGRGVVVTAPGTASDFVSRCFFPQSGIDEDPVTGSAHTMLMPYWAGRLGRQQLSAIQLSARRGYLQCELSGDRVFMSGYAKTFLKGELLLP